MNTMKILAELFSFWNPFTMLILLLSIWPGIAPSILLKVLVIWFLQLLVLPSLVLPLTGSFLSFFHQCYIHPDLGLPPLYQCSVSFPTHNHLPGVTRMTAMLGGDTDIGRSLPLDDIPALEKIAISSVLDHLKISNPPDFIHTAIHKQAIPQYYVCCSPSSSNQFYPHTSSFLFLFLLFFTHGITGQSFQESKRARAFAENGK